MENTYMGENITTGDIISSYKDVLPQVITDLAMRRNRRDREIIFELTKECASATAKAIRQFPLNDVYVYREEKILLLEALYMTYPDFDAETAIERLGDQDRFVRREAYILLATRGDFKRVVRSILEGGHKRWKKYSDWLGAEHMAKQILAVRTSGKEPMDDDGACLRALAERDSRSILWAFPGGLPSVCEGYAHRAGEDDGKLADSLYRACYIALMMSAQDMEVPPLAKRIQHHLLEVDLQCAAYDVFRRWRKEEREEDRKGVLVFFGCHMHKQFLPEFEKYIAATAEQGRMDRAADALSALTLGQKSLWESALLRICREHENPLVRTAADTTLRGAGLSHR